MQTIQDRFWSKVRVGGPDDCWIWTAGRNKDGYGEFTINKVTCRSHRVSLELSGVTIPAGKFVCHRCNVQSCVNPKHLYIGDHRTNTLDRMADDNWVQPIAGFGEDHPCAVLTWDKVDSIRDEYAKGASNRQLGRKYGVSQTNISAIVRRKTWRVRPCQTY